MSGKVTSSNNAYIDADFQIKGAETGMLFGLTFAVKDMYSVRARYITGFSKFQLYNLLDMCIFPHEGTC